MRLKATKFSSTHQHIRGVEVVLSGHVSLEALGHLLDALNLIQELQNMLVLDALDPKLPQLVPLTVQQHLARQEVLLHLRVRQQCQKCGESPYGVLRIPYLLDFVARGGDALGDALVGPDGGGELGVVLDDELVQFAVARLKCLLETTLLCLPVLDVIAAGQSPRWRDVFNVIFHTLHVSNTI